jgi:hypothetical protein
MGGISACMQRERVERVLSVSFHSSSSQIQTRVSPSPFWYRARGWVSVFWEGVVVV